MRGPSSHRAIAIPHSRRGAGEGLPGRNYRGESEQGQGGNHSQATADSDDGARLLPERDHLHVTFPGYFGAPPPSGAAEFENWASRGESLSLDQRVTPGQRLCLSRRWNLLMQIA